MSIEQKIDNGERYVRHAEFLEAGEQQKYFDSKILLAGCGAGSNVAPLLARLGIGRDGGLVLADPDVVDVSNLNRQAFDSSSVGKNKAVALADIVRSINPDFKMQTVEEGVTSDNVDQLVKDQDIVVDMVDIAKPGIMLSLHDSAKKHKKPLITMYDVGHSVVGYFFDYRNPEQMDLRELLGLPDDTTFEELDGFNAFGLAIQCVIGKSENQFENTDSARAYYDNLTQEAFEEILPKIPREIRGPLIKLMNGDIDYVPQDVSAAYAAGLLTSIAIRNVITDRPVIAAPMQIKLDARGIVEGNI